MFHLCSFPDDKVWVLRLFCKSNPCFFKFRLWAILACYFPTRFVPGQAYVAEKNIIFAQKKNLQSRRFASKQSCFVPRPLNLLVKKCVIIPKN